MTLLSLLLAAAGVPVLLAALYLGALTLVARLPHRARTIVQPRFHRRFVIVVPAHNEAAAIRRTLESLDTLAWPGAYRRVVVVADNCTDRTASIAQQCGAEVFERTNDARRGKGYALEFAFRRLLSEGANDWHAAVVVDADSVVSPNLLQAFSAAMDRGARAVQAAYLGLPPRGPLAVITQVALTAIHVVRGTARERLTLSTGLKGNGMAFTRALLAQKPHAAYSRVEDLEFGVQLALDGVRVAFAGEANVWGDMPESERVATRQRERWIGGRVEVARRYAVPLFSSALRRRSFMRFDAAVDLVMPPVSVLALTAVGGAAAAALVAVAGEWLPLAIWGGALGALAVHVLDAALRAGLLWELTGLAMAIPRYAYDKLAITLRAPARFGSAWVRTARTGEVA